MPRTTKIKACCSLRSDRLRQQTQPLHPSDAPLRAPALSPQVFEVASADLLTTPALPLEVLANKAGIPNGTMAAVRGRGEGPRTFVVGRRVFVLIDDWASWMRWLAERGGVVVHGRALRQQNPEAGLTT